MTPQEKEVVLNALKREYKVFKELEKMNTKFKENYKDEYNSIRTFCLDTQLISFNDIELLEYEVNQSFL